MAPHKKNQKTKEKCYNCTRFEEEPVWGHPLCPQHRDCTGENNWEPEKCTCCKKQKMDLSLMTKSDKEKSLEVLLDMLEQTDIQK